MAKFCNDFLFGLAFGCGFSIAVAVLRFVAGFLSQAHLTMNP
jgi:hypothetical protein